MAVKKLVIDEKAVRNFMESVFGTNHMGPTRTTPEDVDTLVKQLATYTFSENILQAAAEWVKDDIKRAQGGPLAALLALGSDELDDPNSNRNRDY